MFIKDGKRFNIYAGAVIGGVQYANLTDPELREQLGITEVADPEPPAEYLANPDHYFVTEQDYAPYVVYTLKNAEQIAELERQKAKAARQAAVDAIEVTTSAGNTFDGDEISQTRMSRALAGMDDADTIKWILSNNTVVDVGRAELREALRLAGAAQAALWVI